MATISFSQSELTVRENEGVVKVELVRSGDTSSEVVVLIGSHPYSGSAAGLINACMTRNDCTLGDFNPYVASFSLSLHPTMLQLYLQFCT